MIRRNPIRPVAAAVLAACALAWTAGCAEDDSRPAAGRSDRAAASPAVPEPDVPEDSGSAPGTGRLELSVSDGRATVVGLGVSRRQVLAELAGAAGFKLSVRNFADRAVDLQFRSAPLGEVLAAVLRGDPYTLDYRVDEVSGSTRLFRVRVGPPLLAARAGRGGQPAAERPERDRCDRRIGRNFLRRLLKPRSPEVRARRREQIENRMEARAETQAELIAQLDEPDAQDRLAALEQLEISGAGLEWAAYLAESDPSVAVRRAAVARLGEEGSFGALTGVVVALDDPAPEVVIEALGAIDMVGDPSMLPLVQPLFDHPDPKVREAARQAALVLE